MTKSKATMLACLMVVFMFVGGSLQAQTTGSPLIGDSGRSSSGGLGINLGTLMASRHGKHFLRFTSQRNMSLLGSFPATRKLPAPKPPRTLSVETDKIYIACIRSPGTLPGPWAANRSIAASRRRAFVRAASACTGLAMSSN